MGVIIKSCMLSYRGISIYLFSYEDRDTALHVDNKTEFEDKMLDKGVKLDTVLIRLCRDVEKNCFNIC